ncbi:hypothetical protein KCMC57_up60790 [Kitasatospora sp. CMC57]|uniref:Uncharacterized protein n=1 Tax=Kitasatospora sp. CMC57 TaxID=3231513 RepID=A0AB33K4H9_9ACTN
MSEHVELSGSGSRTWYEVEGDGDPLLLLHGGFCTSSQSAVVPGASHGLPLEQPAETNWVILDFLAHDPTPTAMPVRRVGAGQLEQTASVGTGRHGPVARTCRFGAAVPDCEVRFSTPARTAVSARDRRCTFQLMFNQLLTAPSDLRCTGAQAAMRIRPPLPPSCAAPRVPSHCSVGSPPPARTPRTGPHPQLTVPLSLFMRLSGLLVAALCTGGESQRWLITARAVAAPSPTRGAPCC